MKNIGSTVNTNSSEYTTVFNNHDSTLGMNKHLLEYTFEEGEYDVAVNINGTDKNNQLKVYAHNQIINIYSVDSLKNIEVNVETNIDIMMNIDPIYFGFDKHYLTSVAKQKLDSLILFLLKHPEVKIIIKGHTDAIGTSKYNYNLAQKRIKSTIAYLEKHGIDFSRIQNSVNSGETEPPEPNTLPDGKDNPKGRKLNRRVEFIIYKG